MNTTVRKAIGYIGLIACLAACSSTPVAPPSSGHLSEAATAQPVPTGNIPAPVLSVPLLPKPKPGPKVETYSVVVNNIKVQDLLFALARDAKVNVDIHPGITGSVTLNAIDQTLPQLLTRISKQVDMRWEIDGPNLAVMPDTPYLRTYKVDYVNLSRDMTGTISVSSQVASTAGASGQATGAGQSGAGTNSGLGIAIAGKNHFWEAIERNLKELLRESDKILPDGSTETTIESNAHQTSKVTAAASPTNQTGTGNAGTGGSNIGGVNGDQQSATTIKRTTFREAASVIVTPEAGIVTVRATSRQHEKVQEYIDTVMASVRRQVLIEATIAEVSLSDNYQQGINWSALPIGNTGFRLIQQAVGGIAAPASSIVELGYNNATSRVGNISASVKLLDAFGTVKVISSPKLSVLNNQTAVLKVVDNLVYFTIKADTTANQSTTTTTYTTNLNSVPVGLVMNVTPHISDNNTVLLNIRPSITRKFGEVNDPNPDLQKLGVKNAIPVIRTREMESMIRVENGNIAVMGGLMEDALEYNDNSIPGVSRMPLFGAAFQNRDDTRRKTELVVFLRPIVINDSSLEGDYSGYRSKLPGPGFFERNIGPNERIGVSGGAQ